VVDQQPGLDAAQIEALAARQHGDRNLADFRGGEDELDVLRRLFQRLQQRIEGLPRQHVDFVDDVDLVARLGRPVAHLLDDLAHVVDAGPGGRVHLDDVGVARLEDRLAMGAEFRHVDGEARIRCPARCSSAPARSAAPSSSCRRRARR
jgi:hypothetical protein